MSGRRWMRRWNRHGGNYTRNKSPDGRHLFACVIRRIVHIIRIVCGEEMKINLAFRLHRKRTTMLIAIHSTQVVLDALQSGSLASKCRQPSAIIAGSQLFGQLARLPGRTPKVAVLQNSCRLNECLVDNICLFGRTECGPQMFVAIGNLIDVCPDSA